VSGRRLPPSNQELNDALERFGELMSGLSRESEFQQLFTDYPYIFSRTLPLRFEASDVVPLGRPGKAEPDFVVFPSERQPLGSYGIIEIKRPDSKIFKRPERVGTLELAKDLRTAITQSRLYEERLRPGELAYSNERVVMLGNRTEIFIIGGLSRELAAGLSSELYARQLVEKLPHNCKLIPYDSLFQSFQATVPPRLLTLRPGLPVETDKPLFEGLRSSTIRAAGHPSLEGFSCGRSTRSEQEVNMIVAGLYAGDRSMATVRITESRDGQIVGVSAQEKGRIKVTPGPLDLPRSLDSNYLAVVALSESFRGYRGTNGERLGDVVLSDALGETDDEETPGTFALINVDDSAGLALARRQGFHFLKQGDVDRFSIGADHLMFRPRQASGSQASA
jgi:Shedu protein SduA, C-terminal